jgi:hypothetical protein
MIQVFSNKSIVLLCFILISWACLTSPTSFFPICQFDWPCAKKKVQIAKTPQNRRFYGKLRCLPLWPTYKGEKVAFQMVENSITS